MYFIGILQKQNVKVTGNYRRTDTKFIKTLKVKLTAEFERKKPR